MSNFRIRQAILDRKGVIDIDGSYLPRKHRDLCASGVPCDPLPLPSQPPLGWKVIESSNHEQMAKHIPAIFPSTLYQYLAEGVGNVGGKGAFRALTRGYIHWASGRMTSLSFNDCNPDYCHVRCDMRPSMKAGSYRVYLLLKKESSGSGSICRATCECAAG